MTIIIKSVLDFISRCQREKPHYTLTHPRLTMTKKDSVRFIAFTFHPQQLLSHGSYSELRHTPAVARAYQR